jgi:hypothetical protein
VNIKALPLSEVFDLTKDIEPKNTPPNLSKLCLATGRWGLYISLIGPNAPDEEYLKAAPYLGRSPELLVNRIGYFLFDHQDDMTYYFDCTVGDSGPTMWNDYAGATKVYALTCDPKGRLLNENTQED